MCTVTPVIHLHAARMPNAETLMVLRLVLVWPHTLALHRTVGPNAPLTRSARAFKPASAKSVEILAQAHVDSMPGAP